MTLNILGLLLSPVPQPKMPCSNPQSLMTSAIPLNQVPNHPNLTYSLRPIYNDRYFGSGIFNLTITKIQGPALDIIIPIGQYINATTKDLQNMTIAKPEIINMSADEVTNSLLLTVFCINVRGDVPTSSHNYSIVNETATGNLALVLNYINSSSLFDVHYAQLAVWAASDGPNQIPSGYFYNNTEIAWANSLLADAGTPLAIPKMPIIPGFGLWISIPVLLLAIPVFYRKHLPRRANDE